MTKEKKTTKPDAFEEYYSIRKDCKCLEINAGQKGAFRQCDACKRAWEALSKDPSALNLFVGSK